MAPNQELSWQGKAVDWGEKESGGKKCTKSFEQELLISARILVLILWKTNNVFWWLLPIYLMNLCGKNIYKLISEFNLTYFESICFFKEALLIEAGGKQIEK